MDRAPQPGSSPQAAAGDTDPGTVTQEVCRECDVCDGELREVEVAGFPVLLVRSGTQFWALGSRCPHYGAPLCKGVLKGNRLRCPWHGACFDIKTGDIEEYPTLDCLPCFQVKVEDGKVFITARRKDLESSRRLKDMSKRCGINQTTVLLLGGGPASLVCAETLRQEGFTGRVILVTKERHVPYDRTRLSKDMGVRAESIYLRAPEFFTAHDIEVWTEKEAVSIDTKGQKAQFKDGSSQRYDQLLIATGSRPKPLKCPGADLRNVRFLQTVEDANQILELAAGKRLVIVGASFIGMEVASFLSDKASTISVVEKEAVPFQKALGPQVGGVAMKMLQGRGVNFYMKSQVSELRGEDGKVTEAILDGGKKLPADVVVVGIGVSPASDFLKGSPVALDSHGAVLVDLLMKTNVSRVFAAGDVAAFPVALLGGERTGINHWQVAQAHGHVAALSMLKKQSPLHTVPFFWTVLLGSSIRYAGCGKGFTETVVKGSLEEQKFVIFYIKDGYVTAVASLKCDPMVVMVAEALYAGKVISKEEAEGSWTAWLEMAQAESTGPAAKRGS
ncbi:apoptosis-inducing factor 3 [Alligator mississippiensis]|uniref:apoptosis-inducing factor 3 n=1 Tax=Alligator mississippiensis TaxID=8496 RepID=UPI0028774111|nr:apoptosis-inducing factor 3 [Alligator mississippiensis]